MTFSGSHGAVAEPAALRLPAKQQELHPRCRKGEAMKLRFPVGTPTVFCCPQQAILVSRLFGSWTTYRGGVLTPLDAVPGPSVKDNATRRSSYPSSCSVLLIRPGGVMYTALTDVRIPAK